MINTQFIILCVAIIGILLTILYVYNKFIKPKLNPTYVANKEFIADDKHPTAYIMLFTADWCPYCKQLEKNNIFNKFKEDHQDKIINNYKLNIQEINCTNDDDPTIKDQLDKYNIDGFPTIKLLKEGQDPSSSITFDAKPTNDTLKKFVQEVL